MRGVLKAKDERARNDAYFTPDALARAVCERLSWLTRRDQYSVMEPGAGGGAFVRAAKACWPGAAVLGVDVEPQCPDVYLANFLEMTGNAGCSLIVGNPPYLLAEEFVHAALGQIAHGGHVAFLLRLSFLGGQGRATSLWAKRDLRWLIPLTPRPSFTADGKTDASEYAIYVWERGWLGNAEIDRPLWWKTTSEQPRAAAIKALSLVARQGLGFTSGEPRAAALEAFSDATRSAPEKESA